MISQQDIIDAIESFAPPGLQESWDNTGWQLTPKNPATTECTGALVCLDVTESVVDEALREGCNLIISHHPLIFKGLRSITGATPSQRAVITAIGRGIAVYSSHTALDSAPEGVSHELGLRLGLHDMHPLVEGNMPGAGLGVLGTLPAAMGAPEFIEEVKRVYETDAVRVSACGAPSTVSTVALCSGSGGEFIADAIKAGADVYVTSDVRYHDFLDYHRDILIVDTGHYDSEKCTKSIFSNIISEKFPNFAVHISSSGYNPMKYV